MHIVKYKNLCLVILLLCSNIAFANTVEIKGYITEYTCSQQNDNQTCKTLNDIRLKIDTNSISVDQLDLQNKSNDLVELKLEKLNDNQHAVLLANYH